MKILVWILIVALVYDVSCLPQRLKIKITEEDAPPPKFEDEDFGSDDDFLEVDSIKGGSQTIKTPFDLGSLLNFNFFGEGAAKTFSEAHKVVETLSKLALDQVKTIGTVALQSTDFINQSSISAIPDNDDDDDIDNDHYKKSEKVVGVYRKKSINEPFPRTNGNLFEGILGSGLKFFTDSLNLNRILPQQTLANNNNVVNTGYNRNDDSSEIKNNRNNHDNDFNEIKNTRINHDNDNKDIKITRNSHDSDNSEIINTRRNHDSDNSEITNIRRNHDNDNSEIKNTRRNHDNNNSEIKNTRRNHDNNNSEIKNTRRNYNNNNSEITNTRSNQDNDNNNFNTRDNGDSNYERNNNRNDNRRRGSSVTSSRSTSRISSSRSTRKSAYEEDSDFLSDV